MQQVFTSSASSPAMELDIARTLVEIGSTAVVQYIYRLEWRRRAFADRCCPDSRPFPKSLVMTLRLGPTTCAPPMSECQL
jgi:hypothetical protein